MIKRYRLVLNVPKPQLGYHACVNVGSFRTVERALRAAERILSKHVQVETRYSHRSAWTYHCSLYDAKDVSVVTRGPHPRGVLAREAYLTDAQASRLWPQETIVPSVGELGWTP